MSNTRQHNNGYGRGGYNRNGTQNGHNQYQNPQKQAFPPYLDKVVVDKGLAEGKLIEGQIRVNQRNYEESYVDNPHGDDELDILILGMRDRNRAFNGDTVVLKEKERGFWVVNDALYKEWKQGRQDSNETEGVKVNESEDKTGIMQMPQDHGSGDLGKALESLSVASQNTPIKKEINSFSSKKTSKKIYTHLSDLLESDVPDTCLQKTAEVVYISEKKHKHAASGSLKPMANGSRNFALFCPSDSRVPRMMIPAMQCPDGFFDRPQDFAKFIFLAKMEEWNDNLPRGFLEKALGLVGDVEAETVALLLENHIDTDEFTAEALSSLPLSEEQWEIPEEEFQRRVDLRDKIIFTIDPKTARDLDDALHIQFVESVNGKGIWQVGVHIADVSYFVKEGTELDRWASERATSTYLVHQVVPMLPRILCEQLCSLNAGVDRLAFSVIFEIGDDGEIFEPTVFRSIIRSKVKLAYEHAQDFIENPDKDFADNEIPEVFDGVSTSTIKEKVLQLNAIALKLRKTRVNHGALRLDQPKLKFALDGETKMPQGVTIYERKDANSLVEEFMLLANMAVARIIEEAFPKKAILRNHPGPKKKIMKQVEEICKNIGFPLDGTGSSGLLSSSLNKFRGNDALMRSINQVISMLLMKPMQLAAYFCVGTKKSQSDYHHYALASPFYTHFTSPIRRYPDVLVHRFLAASLGYGPAPSASVKELQKMADHCNDMKGAAKTVSEGSDKLFFGLFVKQCGPIEERGVVVNVLDHSFDVLVFKYGVVDRVYTNKLDLAREAEVIEGTSRTLVLHWNTAGSGTPIKQTIQMCTVVDVILKSLAEPTKYQAVIKMRPDRNTHTLKQMLDSDSPLT